MLELSTKSYYVAIVNDFEDFIWGGISLQTLRAGLWD
jgi:hypothetical protein